MTSDSSVEIDQLLIDLKDENPSIRFAAAACLSTIEEEAAVEALLSALDDPDPMVLSCAISGLGEMGALAAGAVLKLSELLNNPQVNAHVYQALQKIGTPEAKGILNQLEKH